MKGFIPMSLTIFLPLDACVILRLRHDQIRHLMDSTDIPLPTSILDRLEQSIEEQRIDIGTYNLMFEFMTATMTYSRALSTSREYEMIATANIAFAEILRTLNKCYLAEQLCTNGSKD